MKIKLFVLALFSAFFIFSCTQEKQLPESTDLTAPQLAEKLASNPHFQQTVAVLEQRTEEMLGLHLAALNELSEVELERYQELNEQYPSMEALEASGDEAAIAFVASLLPTPPFEVEVPILAVLEDLEGYSYDPLGFTIGISEVSNPIGIQLTQSCQEFCNDAYIDEWVDTFIQYESMGATEDECYAAANAFAGVAFNSCMRGCNHGKSIQGN